MHSEYAVEPAAIGRDWETFRYLIEKFGFDKGRLISRMPKRWEKRVVEAAKEAGFSDIRMTSLIERLHRVKKQRAVDFGRHYDSNATWMENALDEHRKRPFRAIIGTVEDNACRELLTPDLCDDDNELITAPISRNVPRTADAIANALLLLAFAARELDIVDPYFNVGPHSEDYIGPLASLLRQLAELGDEGKTIRIHWRTHSSRPPDHILARNMPDYTNDIRQPGFVLQFFEWEEIEGGEDFHDRFVLGDRGGIMIGAGLAEVRRREEYANLTLLDDDHAALLRQRFSMESTTYRRTGRIINLSDDGHATLL